MTEAFGLYFCGAGTHNRGMIRNVLFDMGGVLLHFDPKVFIARLGLADPADGQLLEREIFRSVEWVQLDRGEISDEEALSRMLARIPERLHAEAVTLFENWDEPRLAVEENCALVRDLNAAGYGVYLLTNASLQHHKYWPKLPVSQVFGDRVFLSAEHHVIKPDPAFFEQALAMFGLKAGECVFIDDVPLNVEAAVRCGIRGIVYHDDPGLLRSQLRDLGLKV